MKFPFDPCLPNSKFLAIIVWGADGELGILIYILHSFSVPQILGVG
jgi:hypothetical protein